MISTDSPLQFVINIAAFIVAIGVLVAVHEFGHFWVARKLGIRVLRFSIGFGKPLYRRVLGKDPVEFVIAAVPLGGYVKLLDEREGNVAERDLPRAFNRQPVWKRIATLLAGPAMNLIFAIALYWVLFTAGVPAIKPIVGEITPDSISARAGLRYEDQILEIGGRPTPTLEAATLAIIEDLTDDGTINMTVRGVDGADRELSLPVGERSRALTQPEALLPGLGFEIWRPRVKPIIGLVNKGTGRRARRTESGRRDPGDRRPADLSFPAAGEPCEAEPGTHCHPTGAPRRGGPRYEGHDRRGVEGGPQDRPDRHRAEGSADSYRAHAGGHADPAEIQPGRCSRAGSGENLGHLGVHVANRRSHGHRGRFVAGDFRPDQYRGNNRFCCAAGLAYVPGTWR